MTIQLIIQKAIEGGWNPKVEWGKVEVEKMRDDRKTVVLKYKIAEYLYQWHRFIDYLAEGKSINSFFENYKKML